MMRPVILSRPENTARALGIFCVGVSVTTVSSDCGAASAGCGGGGLAGCCELAGCCGLAGGGLTRARWPGGGSGAAAAPGGGGSGCAWIPDGGGPAAGGGGGGYCCWAGYWSGAGGCAGNPPLGTSPGGRGGP